MISAMPSKQFSARRFETAVSSYERYVGALICSVILIGSAVILLFLFWLATVKWNTNKETVAATIVTGNTSPEGVAEEFEEPSAAELMNVQEIPSIDLLQAITNDPSTLSAEFAQVSGKNERLSQGNQGDRRGRGDGPDSIGDPEKRLSDADRWEIRYTTASREEYAEQLDYFKIELGAISVKTDHITYLSNLSAEKPTSHSGDRGSERAKKRIYFRYPRQSTSKLKEWDLEFLKAAEVPTSSQIVVQFYPNETRRMLLALEQKELGDKSLESVLKTTFGVRATKAGFEYYVIDIKYR